jgi:hypothetical protein
MSIKYKAVYNDGTEYLREDACFAKLKDFFGNAQWEKFYKPEDHGGLKGIRYIPRINCSSSAAEAYWDYLLSKPLWGGIVLEATDGKTMLGCGVLVSVDASPTHMLNTLSIFRHVQVFEDGVNLFKELIDDGCNPDMAFACSGLLREGGGSITERDREDSEHTVLAHGSFSEQDYRSYVGEWQENPPLNPADRGKSYREIGKYVRGGIAVWLCSKGRSTSKSDLLQNGMIPCSYSIVYDKEAKEVKRVDRLTGSMLSSSINTLTTRLNALHDRLVA